MRENLEGIRYGDSPLLTTAQRRPRSAAASPACVSSPGRYLAGTNTSTLRAARASSPGGVAGRLPLSGTATPLRCAAAAAFSPSRSLRTSFAGTAMRPPSPPPAAAVRRIDEAWAGSLLLPLLPHHVKHVCHFSNEEVLLLLETVGLDSPSALDRVRLAGTTGRQLLSLSPQDLELSLGLTKLQARKVGQLQQAVALYDKIALQPGQGTLSEVELRMFLAGRGASSGQTSAMLKLMRTLVSGRSGAPEEGDTDLLGCFDFVAGFDWIAQLLKLHRIPVD